MPEPRTFPIDVPSEWDLLIGGERVAARDGERFAVSNPATGEELAQVARAGPDDLERAVAGAAEASATGTWARTSATERGVVLRRAADLIRERSEELAWLEVANAGHTIADARWEAETTAAVFDYYAGAANKHLGSVHAELGAERQTASTVAATTPADRGSSEGRRTGSTRRWRPRGTSALLTKPDLPALWAVIHPDTHPIRRCRVP